MIAAEAVASYERILRRVRQRVFAYEEAGRGAQAARVIRAIKARCMPYWEARAAARRRQYEDRVMRTWE
ncbi:MAG: hypothetical protein E6Q97_24395 [Desulfurellales bacterium]|nr:MAG: hypothetical protein E6Q97_24395 [Desulfurellales bacterium]